MNVARFPNFAKSQSVIFFKKQVNFTSLCINEKIFAVRTTEVVIQHGPNHFSAANQTLKFQRIYCKYLQQHFASGDGGSTRVAMKPAHSMTRLAKAMRMGFEPYFSKVVT